MMTRTENSVKSTVVELQNASVANPLEFTRTITSLFLTAFR